MRFEDDEQPSGAAAEKVAEPRLLTRTERGPDPSPTPRKNSHRQAAPERGLRSWSARLRGQRAAARQPRSKQPFSKQHRTGPRQPWSPLRFRPWLVLVMGLIGLLALLLISATLYLRHSMVAALPQLDGSRHVSGLGAPVTVTRDAQGVPTLHASTLSDLLFAQGYVTAGDRLWQMDALRRHAAGELAEVLGKGLIEHDRRQRFLQLRATADRAIKELPPGQLSQLEAYARGVNAFIDSHGQTLPIEFQLLAYKPKPWTPRDSLLVSLVMFQDLSTEFPRKLDREALSAHLPANLIADLYPVGSWRDMPPANQSHDITAPHVVEQIPLDPSQSRLYQPARSGAQALQLAAADRALMGGARCEGCRAGSNNWVVSGAHTATGAPLLANDMHLSLSIPDIWYEASLHAPAAGEQPALDVTGFTLPGVPFVIVGRNPQVAWGFTNLGADVQDLRIEHLRGEGDSTQFEQPDGSWAAATVHHEVIGVRGGLSQSVDVLTTRHPVADGWMDTPVISPLYPGEKRALSLSWTAYAPHALSSPFFAANAATDGASLVASLKDLGGPSLNLVWADAAGHIGYHAIGFVPVRGAAVEHPRAHAEEPAPEPTGEAPPDEGEPQPGAEPSTGEPQAMLQPRAHLILSAYHPPQRAHGNARRGPRPAARPAPVHAAPAAPRRSRHARATEPAKPNAVAPQQAVTLAPAPPVLDYTIGGPISPLPVDALDVTQVWTTFIPYDALPSVVDPKNGLLATANARIAADDYPYALTNDWTDPFRQERIVHLLRGRKNMTPADMLRVETDVHSDVDRAFAERLAYAVDHASDAALRVDARRLHQAANLLRDWDGNLTVDSPAAAIVTVARTQMWKALLIPQIMQHDGVDAAHAEPFVELYTWGEKATALELLMQHQPARWLPKSFGSWDDFVASTLADALHAASAPGNLTHWSYGDIHRVQIDHPIFGSHRWISRLVGVRASTGAHPAPGDFTTPDAIGAHFGPSERFIADLSSPDAALGNTATGQSANPHSPWYLDQFKPWLAGQSFALPGAQTTAAHTVTLLP